jgi:hypothetical protein
MYMMSNSLFADTVLYYYTSTQISNAYTDVIITITQHNIMNRQKNYNIHHNTNTHMECK